MGAIRERLQPRRNHMKRAGITMSIVIPAVLLAGLSACGTDSPPAAKPATDKATVDDAAAVKKTPVETPEPVEPVEPAGVFDSFQYAIPADWLAFEEGPISYAIPPGMTSDDDDMWGDTHLGIEPLHTRPGGPGDVTSFKEFIGVVDTTSHTEAVYDGFQFELAIPGGTMSVLYEELAHESGITIVKGNAKVMVDGTRNIIFFEFGEPTTGIPRMQQFLETISVN